MIEIALVCASAFWIGILTSISPCPLATNIAAISFISRRLDSPRLVFMGGMLYALGRTLTYVVLAAVLVTGVLSMSSVSYFLQKYMNKVLGPILIVAGMSLLGLLRVNLPGLGISKGMQGRVESWGIWGAGALGIIFALSFCPISAAMYFGSLIPMSLKYGSRLLLPFLYGIGTAVPVLVVAVFVSFGARSVGVAFNKLTTLERWARWITGAVFILVGICYTLAHTFGILSGA